MSPKAKKTKFSVRIEPLKGGGAFDIRPPEKGEWREAEPMTRRQRKWKGFGSFFAIAFAIFLILFSLGIAMTGWGLFQSSKPLAFGGYDSLKAGMTALKGQDLQAAKKWFAKAQQSFADLSSNVNAVAGPTNHYLDSPSYLDAAKRLIQIGVTGSQVGLELTSILEEARGIPQIFLAQNVKGDSSVKITDILRGIQGRVEPLSQKVLLLRADLEALGKSPLPAEIQAPLAKAREPIDLFLQGLAEVRANFGTALKLLGDKVPHSYLVLMQNNHELRATGGFIGSYLLVDVNDGAIAKLEAHDVYETDGNLIDVVKAPPGIDQVADRLYMRDANYSPDFPTSARQIMWFLEHSRGPSVDTVIAINQTVAEKLLELTGPVDFKGFPMPVTAKNFNDLFSFHIESKQSATSTPKQSLIDFIPSLKDKLFGLRDFSKLGEMAEKLIKGKDIQVYSEDEDIEALATRLGLDGKMVEPDPKTDFVALVTTAIGGNKSDAFIQTQVDHHTKVGLDGKITDTLTIAKTHTWTEKDFSTWQALINQYGTGKENLDTLRYIQGEGKNMDYLRVYVPKGSLLVGLEGADLEALVPSEDLGYTVFALPFGPVVPGQKKTVSLSYQLPFALNAKTGGSYKFIAQKQAGAENMELKKSLEVPASMMITETFPKTTYGAFTLYPEYETPFDSNQIFLSAIKPVH